MRLILTSAAWILLSALCYSQTPEVTITGNKSDPVPGSPAAHDFISFDDLLKWWTTGALKSRLGNPVWLPDGSGILLSVREKTSLSRFIQRIDFPGGLQHSLVPGMDPSPSPDGKKLAFIDKGQLWLADIDGSNAQQISNAPGSIESILGAPIAWSGDSSRVAYAYFNFWTALQSELWIVDASTGVQQLEYTATNAFVTSLSWHPDGERLVFAEGDIFYSGAYIVVYSLTTKKSQHLAKGVSLEPLALSPSPSPDGALIAFQHDPLGKAVIMSADVAVIPEGGGAITLLTDDGSFFNNPIYRPQWAPDGSGLYFQGRTAYFNDEIGFVSTGGVLHSIPLGHGQDIRGEFDLSADGQNVAWISHGPYGEEQLRTAMTDGTDESILLDVTPTVLAGHAFVQAEEIFWTSFDGLQVAGLLLRPATNLQGFTKPAPLVVDVHGGPQASRLLDSSSLLLGTPLEWQAWAAMGYAVLVPAYRSDQFAGFGVWAGALNTQDFEAREYEDVMAGVNHVISLGIADPDRMALYGHSHGGGVAQWVTTNTDLFKAVVVKEGGPGDYEFFYDYLVSIGEEAFIDLYKWWFQGTPREVPLHYIQRSPVTYAPYASTPTMVLAGEFSDGVAGGGWALHFVNALLPYGVEVIYIEYPGEDHVFVEPHNLRDMIDSVTAFFQAKL